MTEPGTTELRGPLLRVVRGSATPEELAALVAVVAARGYVDDVIDPRETRSRVAHALEMLVTKAETVPAKKHGNIPL